MRLRALRAPTFIFIIVIVTASVSGCARAKSAASNAQVVHGREIYGRYCATCHGPEANGYAADNAPSLRTSTFLATASDEFLRDGIARGRPGTAMAAYGRALGGPLDPPDVDAIVAFLRDGGPGPRALPPLVAQGDTKRGGAIYATNCARCHGTPNQRSSAVHLANPVFLETASDAFLRFAIEAGRPPTTMAAWQGALSAAQIDDVIAYLRSMPLAPAATAAQTPLPPLPPRTGPVVLNPRGRAPDFTLREDRFVSIVQVKKALDQKRRIVIADARPPSDWLSMHITGAISTPYYDMRSLDDIPNDGTWVIAYCACPHHVSGEVVDELRKRGYKHAAVLDEGVYAWQHAGYPVVTAPDALPSPAPPPLRAPTPR